ncbi:hypothetical protein B4Q04_04760 [Zobellia sp. OII3]|uniref:hypothetical protein n=1 Tax=Zobellia sp. OII3 TaxID=2034520 RepID=UPI000B530D08|nr:hypothetical protein [Zobellia sp. OII3]OWW26992.1 hypothetical protein B4Q04_04760 [Zobellia sp. OII3]
MEKHIEHKVKSKAEKFIKKTVKILFYIVAGIGFLVLFAYIFMYLWNWLMPEIFGLTTLDFWQAGGLLILAKIIFGNFSGGKDGANKGNKKKKRERACKGNGSRMWCDDFSKWEFYDEFWKKEGEQAYNDYLERKKNDADQAPS